MAATLPLAPRERAESEESGMSFIYSDPGSDAGSDSEATVVSHDTADSDSDSVGDIPRDGATAQGETHRNTTSATDQAAGPQHRAQSGFEGAEAGTLARQQRRRPSTDGGAPHFRSVSPDPGHDSSLYESADAPLVQQAWQAHGAEGSDEQPSEQSPPQQQRPTCPPQRRFKVHSEVWSVENASPRKPETATQATGPSPSPLLQPRPLQEDDTYYATSPAPSGASGASRASSVSPPSSRVEETPVEPRRTLPTSPSPSLSARSTPSSHVPPPARPHSVAVLSRPHHAAAHGIYGGGHAPPGTAGGRPITPSRARSARTPSPAGGGAPGHGALTITTTTTTTTDTNSSATPGAPPSSNHNNNATSTRGRHRRRPQRPHSQQVVTRRQVRRRRRRPLVRPNSGTPTPPGSTAGRNRRSMSQSQPGRPGRTQSATLGGRRRVVSRRKPALPDWKTDLKHRRAEKKGVVASGKSDVYPTIDAVLQNKLMVALKAKLTEVSKKLSKAEFDNSMLKSRDVKHAEQISKLQARLQEAEERRAELHGQVVKLKDVLASRSHAAGQPRYPILRTLSTVPVERWTKQQRHEMISLLLTPRAEDEATLSTALADALQRPRALVQATEAYQRQVAAVWEARVAALNTVVRTMGSAANEAAESRVASIAAEATQRAHAAHPVVSEAEGGDGMVHGNGMTGDGGWADQVARTPGGVRRSMGGGGFGDGHVCECLQGAGVMCKPHADGLRLRVGIAEGRAGAAERETARLRAQVVAHTTQTYDRLTDMQLHFQRHADAALARALDSATAAAPESNHTATTATTALGRPQRRLNQALWGPDGQNSHDESAQAPVSGTPAVFCDCAWEECKATAEGELLSVSRGAVGSATPTHDGTDVVDGGEGTDAPSVDIVTHSLGHYLVTGVPLHLSIHIIEPAVLYKPSGMVSVLLSATHAGRHVPGAYTTQFTHGQLLMLLDDAPRHLTITFYDTHARCVQPEAWVHVGRLLASLAELRRRAPNTQGNHRNTHNATTGRVNTAGSTGSRVRGGLVTVMEDHEEGHAAAKVGRSGMLSAGDGGNGGGAKVSATARRNSFRLTSTSSANAQRRSEKGPAEKKQAESSRFHDTVSRLRRDMHHEAHVREQERLFGIQQELVVVNPRHVQIDMSPSTIDLLHSLRGGLRLDMHDVGDGATCDSPRFTYGGARGSGGGQGGGGGGQDLWQRPETPDRWIREDDEQGHDDDGGDTHLPMLPSSAYSEAAAAMARRASPDLLHRPHLNTGPVDGEGHIGDGGGEGGAGAHQHQDATLSQRRLGHGGHAGPLHVVTTVDPTGHGYHWDTATNPHAVADNESPASSTAVPTSSPVAGVGSPMAILANGRALGTRPPSKDHSSRPAQDSTAPPSLSERLRFSFPERCILAEVECLLCLPVDDVASSSLWSPSPTAAGARSATAGSDGKRQPTDQGMPHAPVYVCCVDAMVPLEEPSEGTEGVASAPGVTDGATHVDLSTWEIKRRHVAEDVLPALHVSVALRLSSDDSVEPVILRMSIPSAQAPELVALCLGESGKATFAADWGVSSLLKPRQPTVESGTPETASGTAVTGNAATTSPGLPAHVATSSPSRSTALRMALTPNFKPRALRHDRKLAAACAAELIDFVASRLTLQRVEASFLGVAPLLAPRDGRGSRVPMPSYSQRPRHRHRRSDVRELTQVAAAAAATGGYDDGPRSTDMAYQLVLCVAPSVTLVEAAQRPVSGVLCHMVAEITRPHRSAFRVSPASPGITAAQAADQRTDARNTAPAGSGHGVSTGGHGTGLAPSVSGEAAARERDRGVQALQRLLALSEKDSVATGQPTLATFVTDPGVYVCVTEHETAAAGHTSASTSGGGNSGREVGTGVRNGAHGLHRPPQHFVVRIPLAASVFVALRAHHAQELWAAVEDGGLSWLELGSGRDRRTSLVVRRSFFASLGQRLLP